MKTLVLELPNQAASRLEALERMHGERLQQLLEKIVSKVLERVERAPEAEFRKLEEVLDVLAVEDDDAEFQATINYLMDKNAELYRRLA